MQYNELFTWVLRGHAASLSIGLVGLYRYSDRTTLFQKTLADMSDFLTDLRHRISASLEERLGPVFEDAGTEVTLDSDKVMRERPRNPVGSDRLREALRRFVDDGIDVMADYRAIRHARRIWCRWARVLSWIVLLFAVWESLCVALVAIGGKLLGWSIPERALEWSFAPTAFFAIAFFICQGVLLKQHDTIHNYKDRYDDI